MNKELQNQSRKRTVGRRETAFVICLLLLLTVAVGTTAAFMFVSSDTDTVVFDPAAISCRVISDDGDYSVENTGDAAAYIRAAVIVTWQDDAGNIYGKDQPAIDEDYSYMLNLGDWFVGDDGYYYHAKAVETGDATANLIESFEAIGENAPEGYYLNVEVVAGAVQSDPEKAVTVNWGMTVLEDGSLGK